MIIFYYHAVRVTNIYFLEHILEKSLNPDITKIDKDRHICYTEQKIGEDVMYKIVICDDDKNFIFYMKEMLLRCDLSERQVTPIFDTC